jgi:hypothetical protein
VDASHTKFLAVFMKQLKLRVFLHTNPKIFTMPLIVWSKSSVYNVTNESSGHKALTPAQVFKMWWWGLRLDLPLSQLFSLSFIQRFDLQSPNKEQ